MISAQTVQDWPEWISRKGSAAEAQWHSIIELLRRQLELPYASSSSREQLDPYVEKLLSGHGNELLAIIFYGSCLFSQTQASSSFPDFYLLVSDFRKFHGTLLHSVLNTVLPPNVYFGKFSHPQNTGPKQLLRFKCCVMSLAQYLKETSRRAEDIHHLGRFSKKFAILYSLSEETSLEILQGALQAMLTLIPFSLALLPDEFTLEEFILKQLSLSYLGEKRVTEPTKVIKLLDAAHDYYYEIYPRLLELYALRFDHPHKTRAGTYRQRPATTRWKKKTQRFLARSRLRGILRWPKYILTVDNWVDYLVEKLERHHGVNVELTPLQRRFPLIFGWPVYFKMRRKGIVK